MRTEAGSVGAQVTAAVGSAAEAATPMIALSAAPGAPAACLGKPLLPDVAATAGLRENSPAQQVVPALLSLTDASFGTHRLTLRLDPAELGQVEIRIDRPASGPAEIRIAAERPETLVLLQHDRHQLEQALDQAGISAGRQIEFQLAPRIEAGANPAAAGGSDASGESASGRHGFGSGGDHGEDNRQGRGDRAAETSAGAQKWLRAGVDITA